MTTRNQGTWSLDDDDGLKMTSHKRAELMAKIAQNRDKDFAEIVYFYINYRHIKVLLIL